MREDIKNIIDTLNNAIVELGVFIRKLEYPIDEGEFKALIYTIDSVATKLKSLNWELGDKQWRAKETKEKH